MQATSGFSADTEILTRRGGWVTFDRLTYMDEVATRSPDGRFEWQVPERITWQPYEGDMVRFHGRSLDLLTVPAQSMLWLPDRRNQPRPGPASSLLERAVRLERGNARTSLVSTSAWDGPDCTEKIFLGIKRARKGPAPRTLRMTGDQFAAFMGMYMAEGCTGRASHDHFVDICQMAHGKGYEEYLAVIADIWGNPRPGRTGHAWRLYSRPLYEYLHPLGKALTKWIPPEVLELSHRQLEIFWQYYFLGDGNYETQAKAVNPSQVVATGSRQMAGRLQEIVQKLGYSASVRKYAHRPNALVKAKGFIYKIRIRRTVFPACFVSPHSYRGHIGAAEATNGVIYVRRDGHPAWAGAQMT